MLNCDNKYSIPWVLGWINEKIETRKENLEDIGDQNSIAYNAYLGQLEILQELKEFINELSIEEDKKDN